ncbi:hypothetical protein PF005_g6670 [Phytophthora fragariae]|uniref:Uncharacterized protein n=2 Tax=Phytophthora fragariae TaxID=53985 RepID=A0A6A3FRF5_9STRA|nr:hypothetical protein PF003_g124 [Phytophthora fragariae]KAE8947017.1 hypothetical protein PF009_g3369 [Phytophthora fragariae]KAE9022607.1 hypothetical protein PF011_g4370 [Phytophthora fragariae]KAE9124452.1 hypothetical protein PF010_g6005 [Phytophthora fragariae]KAE9127993.1 hypothetical protein PF007_g5415 [Phytophthora fragariae]
MIWASLHARRVLLLSEQRQVRVVLAREGCRHHVRRLPPTQGAAAATNCEAAEAAKYPKFHKMSNRLGGVDLTGFRDTVGAKRAHEEDKATVEASYANTKRIRAIKATTALKTKLDSLENNASNMRGGILKTLLLLREESERKADARRDEKAANEAHLLEAKAEAEARRREENLEREKRARPHSRAAHINRRTDQEGVSGRRA